MDYRKSREVDDVISTVEWMKDRINEQETDIEKLEEREKELMDEVDTLKEENIKLMEKLVDSQG